MKFEKSVNFSFRLVLAVLLGGSTAVALADMEMAPRDGTNTSNEGRAPWRWAQQNNRVAGLPGGERLIDRLLASDKLTAELGLQADTVAKVREESHAIQTQQAELNAQIRKLSIDQASRMCR